MIHKLDMFSCKMAEEITLDFFHSQLTFKRQNNQFIWRIRGRLIDNILQSQILTTILVYKLFPRGLYTAYKC